MGIESKEKEKKRKCVCVCVFIIIHICGLIEQNKGKKARKNTRRKRSFSILDKSRIIYKCEFIVEHL